MFPRLRDQEKPGEDTFLPAHALTGSRYGAVPVRAITLFRGRGSGRPSEAIALQEDDVDMLPHEQELRASVRHTACSWQNAVSCVGEIDVKSTDARSDPVSTLDIDRRIEPSLGPN